MSLEEALKENTASNKELSKKLDAILKAGGIGGGAAAESTEKKSSKKGPTLDTVKALAEKLRDATDKSNVVKLLKKVGKVGTVAELDAKHYAAATAALTAAIKEAEDDDDEDDDEDDDDDDEDDD